MHFAPSALPSGISYQTEDPKREFIEHLVKNELKEAEITFDPTNYLQAGEDYPALPQSYETINDFLSGLRVATKPGMPFVVLVDGNNSNLAYMRVRVKEGKDFVASLVVNRWHDNVAFMLGEEKQLNSIKDSVEFIKGMIGSYPNMFFDVKQEDIPDFLSLVANFDASEKDLARFSKYGINRSDDRFWDTYDWFQKRFNEDEPVSGGLLDLNRYYYNAE